MKRGKLSLRWSTVLVRRAADENLPAADSLSCDFNTPRTSWPNEVAATRRPHQSPGSGNASAASIDATLGCRVHDVSAELAPPIFKRRLGEAETYRGLFRSRRTAACMVDRFLDRHNDGRQPRTHGSFARLTNQTPLGCVSGAALRLKTIPVTQPVALTVPRDCLSGCGTTSYAVWGLSTSRMMRSRRERCFASGGRRLKPAAFA